MLFLSTLLISMFITLMLVPILRTAALKLNWGIDMPEQRKMHTTPKARVGGMAMAFGVLMPVMLWFDDSRFVNAVLIGAWIIVLFGILDDLKGLGWKTKFFGQFLAAAIVVFYGNLTICHLGQCLPDELVLPEYFGMPLTMLAIVGVTNAINLSDGLDGLAGGVLLLIFICIGYLAYTMRIYADNLFIMMISLAAIGSLMGFLRFNTFPSTIFMGDTGSQMLGFLAGTLSIGLTQSNPVLSPVIPLLLLGFPVLDTLVVMTERIRSGRSPFEADKNHFHHKLIRMGLFHTEAVAVIYAITAGLVTTAFLLRFHSEWLLLGMYAVFAFVVSIVFAVIDRHGWSLDRKGFFDVEIKQRLRFLKHKAALIKIVFLMFQALLPLLMLATCLLPAKLPAYLAVLAICAAALVTGMFIFRRSWLSQTVRTAYYVFTPLLVYFGLADPAGWVGHAEMQLLDIAFGLTALLTVMTLKLTRRQKGFKASPADFLILVIALVVPNLPDPGLQSLNMGALAVKIIILCYSFEVLIGELRGCYEKLSLAMLSVLLLVIARGLI